MTNREFTWKPKEGEELFRTLAETTSAAIFILEDLRIRYSNAAARIITGYEVDELLGMDFRSLAAPAYRDVLTARGFTGSWVSEIPMRYEMKLLRKDGAERWVDLTAGQTSFEAHPALVVTAFDISDRDEAEQALRQANQDLEKRVAERTAEILIERQRLLTVLQTQPAAVWIAAVDGSLIEKNEMADRLLGGDVPMADSIAAYEQYPGWNPETGEPLRAEDWAIARAIQRGETVIGDVVDIQRLDGSRATILNSAAPILDIDGNQVGAVAVAQDITIQRRLERQARQDAKELDAIFESIHDAVVVYRTDKSVERANAAAIRIYGFNPFGMSQREITQRLSFQTLDGNPISLEGVPSSRALQGETVNAMALRVMNSGGEEFWVEASSAPLYTGEEVTGAVVVWHDISVREQLLSQLSGEQARLQAVIQYAPEAIIMIDTHANILLANPVARHLYGQAIPEQGGNLLNMGVIFMQPDGVPLADNQHPLLHSARDGVTYANIEMLIELPGGQQRMVLGSASPVFDNHGELTGAVAVFQDITQLKHSEEASRRETARLGLLAALSQAIAEAGLYYPAVLSTIAERVAESIGDGCIIRLVSDDGQWLDPVAFHHNDPEVFSIYRGVLHSTRKRVDEGYSGHVFRTGEALIVLDMSQDELVNADLAGNAFRALQFPVQNGLIVPLRAQNRFIGTLIVFRSHTRVPFSSEDQVFLQDLADRAALAIDNARLYAAEAQRARELDALHKAASALLSTLDLDALLGQILDAAQNAIPAAEKGLLHLINPGTSELSVRAMLGYQNPRIQKMSGNSTSQASGHNFLLQAVHERRALLIRDTQGSDLDISGDPQAVRSAVVAPLIVENKVLGVLSLSSTVPSAFNDSDLRLLVSLAATTTAAIQNALLHSEVQRLAITDALTGLYNRRGFFDLGQREIDRSHRFGRTLSAIMLDIDHFKLVNDTYGHSVGDQVLATLARRCRTNIRHVDILCRYGGEEFAILLPETDLFTAAEIAERIRRSIADEPFSTDHDVVKVTISLGVTRALPDTAELQELLERADIALYRAKEGGRNRVEVA